MTAVAADTHREEPNHKAALLALFAGQCWRCRTRFPKGASVINEGKHKLAHAECVDNEVQPPAPPPPAEELLDETLHHLGEIAKLAHLKIDDERDPRELLEDIYLRASGAKFSVNEQRTRSRG